MLGGACRGRSRLGPWFVTSRIRQPWMPRVAMKTKKEIESNSDLLEPNFSSRTRSPQPHPSSSSSPINFDSWQKPTKVTCHHLSVDRFEETALG